MTSEEYHQHPAVGSSQLKDVLRSPMHYLHRKQNPKEPGPAQKFGSLFHEARLEPDLFFKRVVVMPPFSGKGSVAAKEAWTIGNHGKTVVSADQMATVVEMLKAIDEHRTASALLTEGAAEESYFDICPDTGIVRKVRPDYLREGRIIVDLKTTEDATPSQFPRSIVEYSYHLSAAYYLDVVSRVTGQSFDKFIIIAIEKKPPYGISVHLLDEGTIEAGRFLYKKALRKLKACRDQNRYEGYPDKILTTAIPAWAWPYEDESSMT